MHLSKSDRARRMKDVYNRVGHHYNLNGQLCFQQHYKDVDITYDEIEEEQAENDDPSSGFFDY